MWKADQTYRETNEPELEDRDSIRTVLFTAGTALLMAACLRRAVVPFLVEQWRVWVFLALNLIVLAIFFTSNPSNPSDDGEIRPNVRTKLRLPEKSEVEITRRRVDEEEESEEGEEDVRLSKEELNERVEAFIVMFKQQLISDAKKGGNGHTSR